MVGEGWVGQGLRISWLSGWGLQGQGNSSSTSLWGPEKGLPFGGSPLGIHPRVRDQNVHFCPPQLL